MEGPGPQTFKEHLEPLITLSSFYWFLAIPIFLLYGDFTLISVLILLGGYIFFVCGFVILLSIFSAVNAVVFIPMFWLLSKIVGDKTDPEDSQT